MEETVFTPAIEGMKHMKSDHGEILTKPFLDACKTLLPILGASSCSKLVIHCESKLILWFINLLIFTFR